MIDEVRQALTFDDIFTGAAIFGSDSIQSSCRSFFARDLYLNVPILSAAMDTVTEHRIAIVIGQNGNWGYSQKPKY